MIGLMIGCLALMACCYLVLVGCQESRDEQYEEIIESCVPEGSLVYGADDCAPPLRYIDQDGVYKGVVVDYMNLLSLELGIEINTVPYKWSEAIEALKKGETDLCDVFINKERAKYFVFTDPIYTLRTVMAVKRESSYTLEDIHTMRVATQEGDYANGYMEEYYPEAELIYVHDVGEGLRMLLAGEVDGVIGDEPVVSYFLQKQGISDVISTINTSLYEEPVVLALPKEKADLVSVLNDAIQRINSRGQLEKIQQKWFGISTPLISAKENTTVWKFILLAVAVSLVVALLGFANNYSLKRQVVHRTRQLKAKNDELQLIFDQMPESIMLLDQEGRIINGNFKFFHQKRGGSEERENGGGLGAGSGDDRSVGDERGRTDARGERCSAYLKRICRRPDCQGLCGSETAEGCLVAETLEANRVLVRKADVGSEIYEVRCVPTVFTEENTSRRAVLVVIRDITVDEASSRQLLQSSKMIAIGQLAAGMAHQIRNPLGVIRNQSFIIRNRWKGEKSLFTSLDYIDDSVKRASETIDNVMNFWRVSDEWKQEVPVKELLESVVKLQEKSVASFGIEVEIQCSDDLQLTVSEDALKHIMHNLVSNSIDAMEEGAGSSRDGGGKLWIKASREDDVVEIRCEDNGCGISEANLQNLFNPFFTTKAPGKGTGLGLFIVYSEVEKLGGTISVTSKEKVGTSFVIRIPDGRPAG